MSHRIARVLAAVLAVGVVAFSMGAQAPTPRPPKLKSDKVEVPRGLLPPAGMCRVWVDNVPPGRQPAPTDCASAIRNRPPNGRVIFSEDAARSAKPKADPKSEPKSEPPKARKKPPTS